MKRQTKSGFMVAGAIVLGVLVSAGAIIALLMKSAVEQSLVKDSAKYAITVASNTLEQSIQMALKDMQSIADMKTHLESLHSFSVPVASTQCPDAQNPCRFVMKELSPGVYVNYLPAGVNPPQFAEMTFSYTGNSNPKSKIKLDDFVVKIPLPEEQSLTPSVPSNAQTEAQCLGTANPWATEKCAKYMRGRYCLENPSDGRCRNNNPLLCPASQPIFAGTRFMNGIERANCKGLGGQFQLSNVALGAEAKCRVDQGEWLSKVNDDLSLSCTSFLENRSDQDLCPDQASEKYVTARFSFSANLTAENIQCVPQGGAYDQAGNLQ